MSKVADIAVLDADASQAAAIVELLHAAGMRASTGDDPMASVMLLRAGQTPTRARMPVVVYGHAGELAAANDQVLTAVESIVLPDAQSIRSIWQWSHRLIEVCRGLLPEVPPRRLPVPTCSATPVAAVSVAQAGRLPEVIVVAVSTGGPPVLETLFRGLAGASLPPMLVVQHIPPNYVDTLCTHLRDKTGYQVFPAVDRGLALPQRAYMAPGDRHLVCDRSPAGQLYLRFSDEAPRRGHKPAADVLFESLCERGLTGVGVILTGLGADGAAGLLPLRRRGWATAGQDQATCAVFGMPRAAFELGAVEQLLPIADMATWIRRAAERRQRAV